MKPTAMASNKGNKLSKKRDTLIKKLIDDHPNYGKDTTIKYINRKELPSQFNPEKYVAVVHQQDTYEQLTERCV
ncbi:protein translocase subunit SecA [Acrasis kona]|uniref:Protein translocase subunit SecA n=1 Tax=Acrasis kona TaxID=1008807 RepID=A0AAW2Z1C7_9EUKA